jgi:aminoglycoside/choline kinase family phosphotransferase
VVRRRHKGVTLTDKQTAELYEVFDRIVDVNLAEPKVFVHRDYHSRNLMVSTPNPACSTSRTPCMAR